MLADRIKHLTEQEIAICAEAVVEQRFSTIPAALREHLEQCDECSAEVAMVSDIGYGDRKESPVALKTVSFSRWLVPLLAAAVLLGFAIWVLLPSQDTGDANGSMLAIEQKKDEKELPEEFELSTQPETSREEANADKTQTGIVEPDHDQARESAQTLLASFTPDPDMELLADNFRSAYRGGQVAVKTPSLVTTAESGKLEWDNPEGISLLVEISDNTGNEIFSVSVNTSSVDLPQMPAGLYYWRLIEEEGFDLLFVGKILSED